MRSGAFGKNRTFITFGAAFTIASFFWLAVSQAAVASGEEPARQPGASVYSSSGGSPLGGLDLGFGATDLSGDFGAPKTTDILSVLATATYRIGSLRLNAALPWMRIDSPGAVFTGIEGSPIIADPQVVGGRRLREGIGDLTIGASYLLPREVTKIVDIDLLFRVKAPTASKSSFLSTRRTDYSFGTTVSRDMGRFAPLVTAFYRKFGESPLFPLRDGFATSVGATYSFSSNVTGLFTYDYAERASRYISDGHQITAGVTALLPRSPLRFTTFVSGGLSRGAPAITAGTAFSVRL